MPRRYDMTRRAAGREETRRRIVEATAKLHGERGVLGTTWQDIAREADVSVSTVYAHFPSLEQLLPACGQLVMSRIRPPAPGDAAEIIGDAEDARARLLRVAATLFSFYERGGPHIEVDIRERGLPGMREWEESQRETVAALVAAALVGQAPAPADLRLVSAFFDLPTYKALRTRGVSTNRAAETVADVALGLLSRPPAPIRGGRS
ncbi:MAG TPA: helix-turn-helix domain-containing protein [Thermoleophilaceae bacterium]|nr:helix-turn-helix domain-containing protein [Thermoleophilaceae bacterium]